MLITMQLLSPVLLRIKMGKLCSLAAMQGSQYQKLFRFTRCHGSCLNAVQRVFKPALEQDTASYKAYKGSDFKSRN
jgi:hypothetical protein